ncbi:MAG: proton-conducting transporter membrane subunit [Methanosarcinaceae archaeon]|nr:proton-conducting transporter membrane subunit [Methanosarcinaceae archaeon]
MSEPLLTGGLALLLLGTALSFLYRSKNCRTVSLGLTFLSSGLLSAFAAGMLYGGREVLIESYSFLSPLEFSFFIDRLSAGFVLLISLVTLGVSLYSIKYVEDEKSEGRKSLHVALMNLFIFSMLLVVLSANGFSFLFFWELMSISSLFLVIYEYEKPESGKAALFYFIMTSLSTVFLFSAFIGLYTRTGSFDFRGFGLLSPEALSWTFLSLFFGFAIKAGAVPFHKWLPYAHPASPSNISALMSGVMLKVAIYGLLRFLLAVEPELWWGVLVLAFGSFSALLGVVYALKENDIKRMLAYSSIENVGLILIGIGLYLIFRVSGLAGLAGLSLAAAGFHCLNHALFKSLLFMAAGSVVHETGTRNLEDLGGLVKHMPQTALLFLIGSVSIAALPPMNGFVSELMLFQAFFSSSALAGAEAPFLKVLLVLSLSAFALTSALAATLFVKVFGITFLAKPRTEGAERAREVPKLMLLGQAIPAALCILTGLFSARLFTLFGLPVGFGSGAEAEVPDMLFVGGILMVTYLLVWLSVRNFGPSSGPRVCKETWGCGGLAQHPSMEYSPAGFSEPLVVIFKKIYRTQLSSSRSFADSQDCVFEHGTAEIRLIKFFEEYLYLPVAQAVDRVSMKVAGLQNGRLDTYVLYVFLAVIALMGFTRWFA